MNLATIIAFLVVLALFIPASIYLYKNGTCGGCPDHGSCSGHCDSRKMKNEMKRRLKESPEFREKNEMIDDIIKKYR
ncbi:hypothetical protein SAMN02910369_02721 [Lachnospiraceae bacterium NE2001]|nr:hypothetical protein SAMN02910369_02721 [Lachnospiraceae bacterium NE2001]